MTATRLTLCAHDGHALAACRHDPAGAPRAQVVIAPAMAIPQRFYYAFTTFLAGLGYRVWTFDYRGMGESRLGPLRSCEADLNTWVRCDFDAMVRHARACDADLPLFVLGHSLGGQTTPLLPSAPQVDGLINIAVGSGALRHNQPRLRRKALLLWHVLVPLFCKTLGYFPGKRLGVIGDVPRGAMLQWRDWCLTPDYLLSGEPGAREAYGRATYPVLGLTFADDELLREAGSRMLHQAYTAAEVDYRVIHPRDHRLSRIGHFGFFKPEQGKMLWPLVADWLNRQCG